MWALFSLTGYTTNVFLGHSVWLLYTSILQLKFNLFKYDATSRLRIYLNQIIGFGNQWLSCSWRRLHLHVTITQFLTFMVGVVHTILKVYFYWLLCTCHHWLSFVKLVVIKRISRYLLKLFHTVSLQGLKLLKICCSLLLWDYFFY